MKLLPQVLLRVMPVTLIALICIGYLAHAFMRNTTLEAQQIRLNHVAVQSAVAIAARLDNIVDTAEALAENDLIKNSLVDYSERDRYIQTLFQSLRVPGVGNGRITLVDYRGRLIVSNAGDGSYSDAPWIADIMEGARVIMVSANGLIAAIPVTLSGYAEGAIVIEYDAKGIHQVFSLPIQSDAYAIGAVGGRSIFSSSIGFTPASGLQNDQWGSDNWMWGETNIAGYPDLRLFVSNRMDTILAAVARQETFLLIAITLSVAAVAVSILVTAIMVTRPIKAFIKGVKRVSGTADLTFRMEPFGSEEFRKLTQNFNNMLARIENTTSSRDYVDGILNSMNELLLVVSPDGKIKSGNRALSKTLSRAADDLAGTDVSCLISDEWKVNTGAENRDPLSFECNLTIGHEQHIPVLVSVSRLRQTGQNSGDLVLLLTDITDQKKSRLMLDTYIAELKRSNADLEFFAYVASHDLKAPLRAISNLTEWIEEEAGDNLSQTCHEYIDLLRGRVLRLDALLEGLLQYARIGNNQIDSTAINVQDLINEVVEMLAPPKSIKVEIMADLPAIHTAATPLRQVLHNLVSNALKHHDRESGFIRITGKDIGTHYEFSVEDDGPGIPEEYHERIFRIFQTLKSRDETEGSGMGLALVQKLVRSYGGSVDLRSRNGERGAVFSFTWKKKQEPEGLKDVE